MKINRFNTLLLFFLFPFSFILSPVAYAGGFQVNLQGQKQAGMGHTGTALLHGSSSAFFNPGALAFTDSAHISLGSSFIIPRMQYLEPYPGIYKAETIHKTGTPFSFYASYKPAKIKSITAGLAVYTPFGSGIQYPDNWKGQFVLRQMQLTTIFIQPTLAYRITENFGVGFGFVYGMGNFELRKAIPVADQTGNYGEGILSGKATGTGYNIGVFFNLNEKLSAGFDYRSGVKVSTTNGQADFTVSASLAEYFPSTTFSTTIQLPSVFNGGLSYRPNNKTTFAFDMNFVGWSVYDTLSFDFAENTDKLQDIHSPRMYKDAFITRFGWQHAATNWLTVRAGAYYDVTPVPDQYVTPETPDSDKIGITSGLSLKLTEHTTLDFSLLFIEGKKRSDINLETKFGGTWKSRAIIPGFSIEYLF